MGDSPNDSPNNDTGVEELTTDVCWELIRGAEFGRLAVMSPDGPDLFPVNTVVDRGSIVFRTDSGSKLEAISNVPEVAFEIDGHDADSGEVWSVVVRGQAEKVMNPTELVAAIELEIAPWQSGRKGWWVRLSPRTVSGRRFPKTQLDEWALDPPVQHRATPIE